MKWPRISQRLAPARSLPVFPSRESSSTPASGLERPRTKISRFSARWIASRRPASRSSSGRRAKAFLGTLAGRPANDRLPESLAAVALTAAAATARPVLVRVHDVAETVRFLTVLTRASRDASRRVT